MQTLTTDSRSRARWSALGLAALVGAAAALSLLNSTPAESQASTAVFAGAPVSFADVIDEVRSGVVTITVTQRGRSRPTASQFDSPRLPPPFDDFFGRFGFPGVPDLQPAPGPVKGLGSGFIIDEMGYVATNNHVVDGAESVTVTLDSGESFDAEVVGHDPQTDIALVRIDSPARLEALEFGDSDDARVGDWVLAIGNPYGLGGTATAGIISARGRDIQSGPYDDYLQIDAPINSGNSGGPVFNAAGEVIGINTAIFSPNGGNIGIGFAIPANLAVQVLADLKDRGTVSRGWLGVQIQPVDEDLAAAFGLDDDSGALIAEVVPASPAARAGLEPGDIVTRFGNETVDSPRSLARVVGAARSGERVALEVWRDGRARSIDVELGEQGDDEPVAAANPRDRRGDPAGAFGMRLEDVTPQIRAELGLPADTRGAVVVAVEPGSPAAEQGIRRGDVIVSVDRTPTDTSRDVERELGARDEDHAVVMIQRGDERRFVALRRSA